MLHHHGVAFENELVAMRIYMDQRQTVDLYGKYRKGLELHDTQFYTSAVQKAQGYGDDVLWVGNTFGLGALRGWDGSAPTMLSDVESRTQRIVAQGPVRTIVEMDDYRWTVAPGMRPVNMTVRYTLYAGHRDCDVTATFSRDMSASEFSTGIINVKSSTEFTDHAGLRGCWAPTGLLPTRSTGSVRPWDWASTCRKTISKGSGGQQRQLRLRGAPRGQDPTLQPGLL